MRVRSNKRVRLAGVAALLGVVALIAGLNQATAAPPPDPDQKKQQVDAKVDALKADLDASTRKLAAAEAAYNAVQAKLPAARAAVTKAKARLADAEAADELMRHRLSNARKAERTAERELRETAADIRQDRRTAGQMARAAYAQGGFAPMLTVLDAESPADFAARVAMVQSVLRSQNAALDRLRDVQGETRRRERALAQQRAEVAVERRAAAGALTRTRSLERQAAAAQRKVEDLVERREAAVAAVESERATDLARYNTMLAEQRRLAELIRKLDAQNSSTGGSGPQVEPGNGALARPVSGAVTSGFGPRFHPILRVTKLHTGTDFSADTGTPVSSAGSGKVITVERTEAYGNRVIVSHGTVNGKSLVSTYNHLSGTNVQQGETVDRGELVGKAGSTGYATGPHLHFEVLVGGEFVDPMDWL